MKEQSYHVKAVLGRKKTFLALKDSPGNPLGRSPMIKSSLTAVVLSKPLRYPLLVG